MKSRKVFKKLTNYKQLDNKLQTSHESNERGAWKIVFFKLGGHFGSPVGFSAASQRLAPSSDENDRNNACDLLRNRWWRRRPPVGKRWQR